MPVPQNLNMLLLAQVLIQPLLNFVSDGQAGLAASAADQRSPASENRSERLRERFTSVGG